MKPTHNTDLRKTVIELTTDLAIIPESKGPTLSPIDLF